MPKEDLFETGPIRPPSEAGSYLIRLTRGCPWNRCGFCRTYRRRPFSIRSVEEVKADIDAMAEIRDELKTGRPRRPGSQEEWMISRVLASGGDTAFLQDADSLAMKPDDVRTVLKHFRKKFPDVVRITTYARSRTLSHRKVEDLVSYREFGLTRIHIGMESGHDPLLGVISKGVTGDIHVDAGRRVKEAGMELSEYFMPGLGGSLMSEGHALDSARVLNAIDPDFIRLRTLCLGPKLELWELYENGTLRRQTDEEIVGEIRTFVEALEAPSARLVSDHILNLLQELEGKVVGDKDKLLGIIDRYLALDPRDKQVFQAGRRAGFFNSLDDLGHPGLRGRGEAVLEEIIQTYGFDRVEEGVRSMMERFV